MAHMRLTVRSLLPGFEAALARGTEPHSAEVKALATRWLTLGTSGRASPEVTQKTRSLIETNEQVQRATGISADLKDYMD